MIAWKGRGFREVVSYIWLVVRQPSVKTDIGSTLWKYAYKRLPNALPFEANKRPWKLLIAQSLQLSER
jgi:hypothetical protein